MALVRSFLSSPRLSLGRVTPASSLDERLIHSYETDDLSNSSHSHLLRARHLEPKVFARRSRETLFPSRHGLLPLSDTRQHSNTMHFSRVDSAQKVRAGNWLGQGGLEFDCEAPRLNCEGDGGSREGVAEQARAPLSVLWLARKV